MKRSAWLFPSVPLLLFGCASDPAGSDRRAAGDDSSSGASGSSNGGRESASCPVGPGEEAAGDAITVGVVTGQLVDRDGTPTSSGLVQICGKDVCINADVGSDGKLNQAVEQGMLAPACKFGNGKAWGKLAIPLGGGDSSLGTLTAVELPAFEDAAPLRAGTTLTSNGVTLDVATDAGIEIDTLTYEDEREHGFRAAKLSPKTLALFDEDFVAAYSLSPVETRICPSPALSIENTDDLRPGTALELLILGLDVLELWAPYGRWHPVGEGKVSDDGRTLEFPDGIPILTAIAIREKP